MIRQVETFFKKLSRFFAMGKDDYKIEQINGSSCAGGMGYRLTEKATGEVRNVFVLHEDGYYDLESKSTKYVTYKKNPDAVGREPKLDREPFSDKEEENVLQRKHHDALAELFKSLDWEFKPRHYEESQERSDKGLLKLTIAHDLKL